MHFTFACQILCQKINLSVSENITGVIWSNYLLKSLKALHFQILGEQPKYIFLTDLDQKVKLCRIVFCCYYNIIQQTSKKENTFLINIYATNISGRYPCPAVSSSAAASESCRAKSCNHCNQGTSNSRCSVQCCTAVQWWQCVQCTARLGVPTHRQLEGDPGPVRTVHSVTSSAGVPFRQSVDSDTGQ